MGRKVFVSYKYSDTSVKDLSIYESTSWGRVKVQTRSRDYVDLISQVLENEDNIYKGEDDGESLANFSDEYIESSLRNKIYDSTITIVLISKGMKNPLENEKDQWIPWEISYSLKEITRNGRTSGSNGILAVVIPDEYGSYEYFLSSNVECGCRVLKTGFLFQILKDNMFNLKDAITRGCSDGSFYHIGESSYIKSIKWDDFIKEPNKYLDKAIEIRDKSYEYSITKNLK